MAEFSQLPALQKADVASINRLVQELNRRIRVLSQAIEEKQSKLALSGDMDAGFHRLTKVATAVSDDDALPLGQLAEELQKFEAQFRESLTSEGDANSTSDDTSEGDTDPDDEDDELTGDGFRKHFLLMGG